MIKISLTGSTAREQRVIDAGESVLFGFSPFNPFYNPQSITEFLKWGVKEFEKVHVVLPGPEAAFRFIATGTEPRRSVRRTIRIVNNLRCVARRSLAAEGYENPDKFIHVWSRFAANRRYRELRRATEKAYTSVPEVRTVIRSMISSALSGDVSGAPSESQIDANVCYVFAEAPILLDAPGVLGQSSTVMAYHRPIPLYEFALTGIAPELTPPPRHAIGRLSATSQEGALS